MSKAEKTAGPPEFEDSPRFHEREWRIQRIGWSLLILILIVGASGLLGKGPMAHDSIALSHGSFEFDRFARRHAPTRWLVNISQPSSDGDLRLAIDSKFLSEFEVRAITPEPQKTEIRTGETVFTFDAQSAGHIVFHLDPQTMGVAQGTLRVNDAEAIPLRQIIYP